MFFSTIVKLRCAILDGWHYHRWHALCWGRRFWWSCSWFDHWWLLMMTEKRRMPDNHHSSWTGKDSCQGDSGGPFTVDVDGKPSMKSSLLYHRWYCIFLGQHHLVGVVSWGFGCAAVIELNWLFWEGATWWIHDNDTIWWFWSLLMTKYVNSYCAAKC